MARSNEIGKLGEVAACDFLIGKGFTIRETNWRMGHLEIDIVAHEPAINRLHIIEVKTRTGDTEHFDPMQSINARKIRNLVNAANGYISYYRLPMTVQYDVIIITGTPPDLKIHFFPNAFQPPLRSIR